MGSKVCIISLALLLATLVLLFSFEVTADETSKEANSNGLNDAKYGGGYQGGGGGYQGGGGGHQGGGGYQGGGGGYQGGGGGGGRCRFGCCRWGGRYHERECYRCCSVAGEKADEVQH